MATETASERARRTRLLRLFNITPEEYELVLAYQKGVCYVCHRPPGKNRLAVDHDHGTGLIRGLVCWQCNAALSKLGDDPDRAHRASQYLRYPPFTAVFGEARYGRTGRTTTRAKRRKKRSA